jgi:SAM-dependent methyltransferase
VEPDEYRRIAEAQDAHWWYRNIRALMADLLAPWLAAARLGDGGRFLDAGCGPGGNGAWLARHGTVVGVDAVDLALHLARERTATVPVRGRLERLPFAAASFDVVVGITVAYAIDDDVGAFTEMARVLRPGGALLVVEPAFDVLRRAHDATVHGVRRYRAPELVGKLGRAGLDVRRATYAYSFLAPPAAVLGAVERRRPPARAGSDLERSHLDRVFAPLAAAERRWLRAHDVPFGTSAIVLATRP